MLKKINRPAAGISPYQYIQQNQHCQKAEVTRRKQRNIFPLKLRLLSGYVFIGNKAGYRSDENTQTARFTPIISPAKLSVNPDKSKAAGTLLIT